MKKLFMVLISIAVLIFSTAIIIALMQPSYYRIQRSAQIHAQPDKIYEQVAKSENWKNWMPWELKEQEFKIIEALPLQRVRIEFLSHHSSKKVQSDFLFVPVEKGTIITWGMDGYNSTLQEKFFFKMKSFKRTLENDFEQGLNNIKTLTEKPSS